MRDLLLTLLEAFCRMLFALESEGAGNVPERGPAVVAANHPSYLDPVLLSIAVRRPIHFMAWDALFKLPLLGALLRAFGAFPVDLRRGRGREAYERARALVQSGEVVGIFPEGRRSQTGWMERSLREGAARLAWETGAPLVPATIAGAFRAWPHFQFLPRPARIKVRFHEPISPGPLKGLPEEQALPALLEELRRRVERTLLPGVKADLRLEVVYRMTAPWPRLYETIPVLGLALLVFARTRSFWDVLPCYAYVAYLLADRFLVPQRRVTKRLRNLSPVLFALAYGPTAFARLGLPPVPAPAALAAVLLGGLVPYLYERGITAVGVLRGCVFAATFALGAQYLVPSGAGPHLALPVFLAAFAWERESVFWPYSVALLSAYSLLVPTALLGAGIEVAAHALAGLLAWLATRLFPYRLASPEAEKPGAPGLGLDLS
jgi:1-acyl-sn-glycerol-3-phosphate acyltransferase